MTLNLKQMNTSMEERDAAGRISFAVEQFGDGLVLLSSMQKTASVLMHMFHTLGLKNKILFVDTGYHFHETLLLRDQFIESYALPIVTLYPTLTPEQQEEQYRCKLFKTSEGQPVCCDLRKGKPFLRYMKQQKKTAVVGGLRRAEGQARGSIEVVAEDPRFSGYSVYPLVDWSQEDIDAYLLKHHVPVHSLHALGYPSIGCGCCTTPVLPGEDARAGRWRHLREGERTGPAYCGMNFTDGSGI
ncbi:MAG: phosphoadenylyl-sulfate reductase [Deltaproteobacteria bacterium]|nr:phosphoadenylyl-sulfate reductase [Deltaproteobacteria bacterium]MBN2671000.1 phosphoadenylyl-sulfate reductase [Deltaproteobacteria bacterium]